MISGGTTTDRSPLSAQVTVTPIIDAAGTSTTARFIADTVSNTAELASSNFNFSIASTDVSGIRITLRNSGSAALTSAVSLYGAAVSNTAYVATSTGGDAAAYTNPNGTDNLLEEGISIATWAAGVNDSVKDYVTDYSDIVAGTTTTTTEGVTAVLTNRTGW